MKNKDLIKCLIIIALKILILFRLGKVNYLKPTPVNQRF